MTDTSDVVGLVNAKPAPTLPLKLVSRDDTSSTWQDADGRTWRAEKPALWIRFTDLVLVSPPPASDS